MAAVDRLGGEHLPEEAGFRQVVGGCHWAAGDFRQVVVGCRQVVVGCRQVVVGCRQVVAGFQQVVVDFRQVVVDFRQVVVDSPRVVHRMAEAGCPGEAEHSAQRLGRLLAGADSPMVGVAPMVGGVLLVLLGVLLRGAAVKALMVVGVLLGVQLGQCPALLPASIAH